MENGRAPSTPATKSGEEHGASPLEPEGNNIEGFNGAIDPNREVSDENWATRVNHFLREKLSCTKDSLRFIQQSNGSQIVP
jgi:hypothetical protein